MTSSQMRTSKGKAACGEDRKDVQQPEDVKPLIVPREGQISVDTDDSEKDLIGDDNIVTNESTSYNEWLAAQGLVGLSGEQPAHGDIHKLHEKDCDEASAENICKFEMDEKVTSEVVNEDKTIDNDNTQVVKAPEMRPKKIKRSDYKKSKMKISKAKKTLLLKGS